MTTRDLGQKVATSPSLSGADFRCDHRSGPIDEAECLGPDVGRSGLRVTGALAGPRRHIGMQRVRALVLGAYDYGLLAGGSVMDLLLTGVLIGILLSATFNRS
ncbi:MAG: hypothetical protein JW751_26100 [Polyangiaceae bacterium]|nr:hypothetical protein [Polyangiaceae bacterium]